MQQGKTVPSKILTIAQLAEELDISQSDALELMKREGFPSTHICRESYVVSRDLLEEWVRTNSGGTEENLLDFTFGL